MIPAMPLNGVCKAAAALAGEQQARAEWEETERRACAAELEEAATVDAVRVAEARYLQALERERRSGAPVTHDAKPSATPVSPNSRRRCRKSYVHIATGYM